MKTMTKKQAKKVLDRVYDNGLHPMSILKATMIRYPATSKRTIKEYNLLK